jgi:aryl-alcohol dehydrogenase-like predicted oxidoreductase
MDYTTLGKTGLRVSVAGLGCGGNSRLGLTAGGSAAAAIDLVHAALDLGVNFFDTAEAYGTEEVLGRALAGTPRDRVVVSSKTRIVDAQGELVPPAAVLTSLETSLRHLQMDVIDVFHLHAVQPQHYNYALEQLSPVLERAKEQGLIRHLGITETPPRDPHQQMLTRALAAPCWEVMMLAFSMMNQAPRETIFPLAAPRGVGTLLMFVVRNLFSRPAVLSQTLSELIAAGALDASTVDSADPFGFLLHEGGASSITDAAYRFARHQAGADVTLFGTGSQAHLHSNVESILKPPLPAADLTRLHRVFGALSNVGLVFPDRPPPPRTVS